MNVLDTFADVLRAVEVHASETRHQDILLVDSPRDTQTGYYCRECDTQWMAHADTVQDLPKIFLPKALSSTGRMRLVVEVIKKALEPKPYRPTAWERVLRLAR
jgi:hypothetical protein